jgi:hypothetical protein
MISAARHAGRFRVLPDAFARPHSPGCGIPSAFPGNGKRHRTKRREEHLRAF